MSYYQLSQGGKQYWTHSSFVGQEQNETLRQLHAGVKPVNKGVTFGAFISTLFVANKTAAIAKLPLQYRAAFVVVPTLLTRLLTPFVYESSIQSDINKQLDGAPLWENKFDVPELDKLYFFLDDDKNYQPSLMHHSATAPKKYQAIYKV